MAELSVAGITVARVLFRVDPRHPIEVNVERAVLRGLELASMNDGQLHVAPVGDDAESPRELHFAYDLALPSEEAANPLARIHRLLSVMEVLVRTTVHRGLMPTMYVVEPDRPREVVYRVSVLNGFRHVTRVGCRIRLVYRDVVEEQELVGLMSSTDIPLLMLRAADNALLSSTALELDPVYMLEHGAPAMHSSSDIPGE